MLYQKPEVLASYELVELIEEASVCVTYGPSCTAVSCGN